MRTALLELTVSKRQEIVYTVKAAGGPLGLVGPSLPAAEWLRAQLDLEYGEAADRARVIRRVAPEFEPPAFSAWFRQWVAEGAAESVLCVYATDSRLATLPWRELLLPSGMDAERAWVAHVCAPTGSLPPPSDKPPQMLLAGWSSGAGYAMPGVKRELNDFASKVGRGQLDVRKLAEATSGGLLDACRAPGTMFLHLSPPALVRNLTSELCIPVTAKARPATDASFDTVTLTDLNKALEKNKHLRMVVINACAAGLGCAQIAKHLGVVAIGWPSLVMDDTAADFTFYFYQRLIEGLTPTAAVRSFAQTVGLARLAVDVPVVWLPSPEWANWCPFPVAEQVPSTERAATAGDDAPKKKAARRAGKKGAGAGDGAPEKAPEAPPAAPETVPVAAPPPTAGPPAQPRLEFRPRAAINPALLVNNVAPIEHINIDSPDERPVHLRIECDTGAGVSVYRETIALKKGVNPVTTSAIHFPALHELVQRRAGRRMVSFTATLASPDGLEIEGQTRTALWMSAREWLDQQDTWAFIPAFVNPFDEGVLKVFEHAKNVLRTLGSPGDAFEGYLRSGSPEYVAMQMKAIFQTLRDESSGLTYITPPGSGVFDPASKRACGQVVRTHSDVVNHRLGTCHDLALLIAACAEYVSIRPLILLVPGHTFVGYWNSTAAQEEFWKKRAGMLITGRVGQGWTISDGKAVLDLLDNGDIALVEATYVCERNQTFAAACEKGSKTLRDKVKHLDVAIDIFAARREVQPV